MLLIKFQEYFEKMYSCSKALMLAMTYKRLSHRRLLVLNILC